MMKKLTPFILIFSMLFAACQKDETATSSSTKPETKIDSARSYGDYVKVYWRTSKEKGIYRYELQRSTDSIHFTSTGTYVPNFNNGNDAYYQRQAPRPPMGASFYRVKDTMDDSQLIYSNIVKVTTPCFPSVNNLTGLTYKIAALKYKASSTSAETDITSTLEVCERDNTLSFLSGGVANFNDAGTVCVPNGSYTAAWSVSGIDLVLDGEAYTISNFTCTSMKITTVIDIATGEEMSVLLERVL